MRKLKSKYIIPFSGLSVGLHNFDFELNKTFIEFNNIEDILDISGKIDVELEKTSTFLKLNFTINAKAEVTCDRCTEPLWSNIEAKDLMIVKFGSEITEDEDSDMVILPHNANEIDVNHFIYELISLSLPSKRVHKESDCNSEVLEKLNTLTKRNEEKTIDPRWSALKNLEN